MFVGFKNVFAIKVYFLIGNFTGKFIISKKNIFIITKNIEVSQTLIFYYHHG